MDLVFVDPRSDARWQALIELYQASVFHSPLWLQVLSQTYGFDCGAYVAIDNAGQTEGGIAFCHIRDFLGERLASLPFSDHADPLVQTEETWRLLVDKIDELQLPFVARCLHGQVPLHDQSFTVAKRAKWHGLNLTGTPESIWQGFESSVRRNIRKSQADGVIVEIASDRAALDAFYQMHQRVRKYKYRLLAQPYDFFKNIWSLFGREEKYYLLLARYRGEVIAGTLFLAWGNTLYYKFNASLPAGLSHRPNDLIVWQAVQLAKSLDCQNLDFGLSDLEQEGLIRFKRQLGSVEKEICHMRSPASEPQNGRTGAKEMLTQLSHLLTEPAMPDEISAKGGDLLYRYFT